MMNHAETIQYLIDKHNYQTYLEIGVAEGPCYPDIKCPIKECCDIKSFNPILNEEMDITYLMPSDEMFAIMPVDKKYDLIFIDGLHDEEYVDRDIINSLKHLNPGGLICVHDVIPLDARAQTTYENYIFGDIWNGDVWKSITKLQDQNMQKY